MHILSIIYVTGNIQYKTEATVHGMTQLQGSTHIAITGSVSRDH